MTLPNLDAEELEVLRTLIDGGPSRTISPPVRGRLALYDLIDETPEGWAITEKGKIAPGQRTPRDEAVIDDQHRDREIIEDGTRGPRPGRRGVRAKRTGPW